MQLATLLFLVEGDQLLLAMKKRGFGEGHWNGVGGKPEVGEKIEEAAIRECQEEIEVSPLSIKEVGILNFYFENGEFSHQKVHVFVCHTWRGNPEETEEMAPKWFKKSEIPYDEMWEDDKYWLPKVLEGKTVQGKFYFDKNNKLKNHTISDA